MNKQYFAKYLPVKGQGDTNCKWQWNNNVQNTGWEDISPSDMDAIIAHGLNPSPQFRKLKLFLCSRDNPKQAQEILTEGIIEGQEFTEEEKDYLTLGSVVEI